MSSMIRTFQPPLLIIRGREHIWYLGIIRINGQATYLCLSGHESIQIRNNPQMMVTKT